MPRHYPIRATSALVRFFLPPNLNGTGIHIFVKGTPDIVKLALRRACSHRRSMVIAKPGYYFCNVVSQIHKLIPQDCGAIWEEGDRSAPLEHISWHYEISVINDTPVIKWGEYGKSPTVEPLFQFFGYEWRRPKAPRKPREGKSRGGRPSNFRKRFPHLITPGKAGAAQNGKTLGLKDKRKIRVDFTGVESVDRSRGETLAIYEGYTPDTLPSDPVPDYGDQDQ